jgi:hypothetical protein
MDMAGIIVHRHVPSPKVEPHMHTRAGLGLVGLTGHCHQGKGQEAANNDQFTFHLHSPL